MTDRVTGGTVSRVAVIEDPPNPRGSVAIAHPHPAHGGNMDHSVVRAIADRALAHALVALRFDFRGVRDVEGEVSDIAGHLDDIRRFSDLAADRAPPGSPRFGAGFSYGARLWAEVALGAKAPPIRGLVLLAPPSRIPRTARDFGDLLLGRPIAHATRDPAILERLASLRVPVRIVVGERDSVAPPDDLARHLAPDASMAVLPGLNHFFSRSVGAGAPAMDLLAPALDAAFASLLA